MTDRNSKMFEIGTVSQEDLDALAGLVNGNDTDFETDKEIVYVDKVVEKIVEVEVEKVVYKQPLFLAKKRRELVKTIVVFDANCSYCRRLVSTHWKSCPYCASQGE